MTRFWPDPLNQQKHQMKHLLPLSLTLSLLFFWAPAFTQEALPEAEALRAALARQDSFRRIDIFPAISYSPETQLTLGAIGYYYFNMGGTRELTRLSNVNFLAIYTTLAQIAIEFKWDIFTAGNRWRFRGETFFNRWPDRNYGRGNMANALVEEVDDDEAQVVNYLRFDSDRIRFAPVILRKVRPGLYLGGQFDFETLYGEKALPDSYRFLNADSTSIIDLPVAGIRSGLGLQVLWDTRDYVLNPLKGTYLEFSTLHNLPAFGSDFTYHSFQVDARKYFRTVANHTLALRSMVNLRYSDGPIPLRGLSRVGGRDLARGYFKGTYQDDHMVVFQAEYRWPFWRPDNLAPFWQLWKRLGIVVFASTAQTFPEGGALDIGDFRTAVGTGLRILFNEDSRVNLRIDYALALSPDSAGPGKRQSGFYFYLAEAF